LLYQSKRDEYHGKYSNMKNCQYHVSIMLQPEMIRNNGYKVESYEVTTSDGYILTLFRIPPADSDNRKGKQPVFMLHGIATDSSNWVDVGNRSLGNNNYT
jgi:hypothetical protein